MGKEKKADAFFRQHQPSLSFFAVYLSIKLRRIVLGSAIVLIAIVWRLFCVAAESDDAISDCQGFFGKIHQKNLSEAWQLCDEQYKAEFKQKHAGTSDKVFIAIFSKDGGALFAGKTREIGVDYSFFRNIALIKFTTDNQNGFWTVKLKKKDGKWLIADDLKWHFETFID